ncbi:hypothetical protein HN51_013320 [Arachis hypogaea]|uniref:KIB1-4 beta-propeller domain-containing protein n=1 Tax=Arachis hypogaea TaxID=3818 RepID=A0A445DQR7_ARAHY|nr:F-box/kelch-repeat protein [Arachis hypogaea]RYR65517.1 hypothetical protein Ahy_A03g011447 [Arachis hypogaea]
MDQHSNISEANSDNKKRNNSIHLLAQIFSDYLELKELLRIRGVCKDWKYASTEALARIETFQDEPWFLMYGEGSTCSLLSNEDKLYTLNIPEFEGATCVASNSGWLLLFRQGSIFFLCPFSRTRIDLPKFPLPELIDCSEYVAAFSSAPTSEDCTVAVINRWHEIALQLHLLRRSDQRWRVYECLCTIGDLSTIKFATYNYKEGAFQILDGFNGLITFDARTKRWRKHVENSSSVGKYLRCKICNNLSEKLGLEKNVCVSTCGTQISQCDGLDIVIQNENIQAAKGSQNCQVKGVWIQPKFFKMTHEHRW